MVVAAAMLAWALPLVAQPRVENPAFVQEGVGAVARSYVDKAREEKSVKDFGAKGDGVSDDRAAIQAAIDALSPHGGILRIPRGTYIVSDSLKITKPIRLIGDGFYSAIKPSPGFSASVAVIHVTPDPRYALNLTLIQGIFVGDPNTGKRRGSHGIFLDTQVAGARLPKFTLRDSYIAQGGGRAVFHLNTRRNNVEGGLYAALFENNELKGGLHFEQSGDSIVVRGNIISGVGVGIYAALVSGASMLAIEDNNITSVGGAIKIDSGSRPQIRKNNIEQVSPGGSNGAMIDVNGALHPMYGGVIEGNYLGAFTKSGISSIIRINNINALAIHDNVMVAGNAGVSGVSIIAGVGTRVGPNSYNANIVTKVVDNGAETAGVLKTTTLLNGWVAFDAAKFAAVEFFKDRDGMVSLYGAIKAGTNNSGTTLLKLPAGYRPAKGGQFLTASHDGAKYVIGVVQVTPAGDVQVLAGANNALWLGGIHFRAAGGADGVSAE